MTATTSIRVATALRVIDLLRLDPDNADTTIRYGWVDEQGIGEPVIYIQVSDDGGTTEVANMKGGRKHRSDSWNLEIWVAFHGTGDEQNGLETAEVVERIFASVENLFADNTTLQLDGSTIPGFIAAAQFGASNGPHVRPSDTGFVAIWHCLVACEARLT